MNNRGEIFNIIVMLILLIVVALAGLIIGKISWEVTKSYDRLSVMSNPENQIAHDANLRLQTSSYKTIDYAIFFLFLFSNVGIVIGAVKTNFSPIFMFLFFMLMMLAIMTAAGFVNMYQGLAQDSAMVGYSTQLTLANFVFSKFTPAMIAAICGLVMVIMWGKGGAEIT